MNNANIEAKNIPTKITPAYAAKNLNPIKAVMSIKNEVPIIPINKTCNLLDIFPLT